MNKKCLIFLSVSMVISLTACKGPVSPGDTVKPPQTTQEQSTDNQSVQTANTQDEAIMDEFNQLKSKNSTPAELLKFIGPEIGNLEKDDADTVVKVILDAQELALKNYTDKIMSEEFNIRLNSYKFEDLAALKNIKDDDIVTLLQNAYNDGCKLSISEGMSYLEIDYTAMKTRFSQFTSEEVSAYIDIMADETIKHFAQDAALMISFDQLAERVIKTESFLDTYKVSRFVEKVSELHKYYLTAYLLGLNNTPAYRYDDDTIENEVLESYAASISKYPESSLVKILEDYTALIEKNSNKKTKEILEFVNRTTAK